MNCLNCEHEFVGTYCPKCGQKSKTKPISWQGLINQLITGITQINRGFLYTVRELLIAPGRIINDYLIGKRVRVYKPIGYALICVTLMILMDVYLKPKAVFSSDLVIDTELYDFGYAYGTFLEKNIKLSWLLNILYYSFVARILFSKNNFAEHLTINAFIIGHTALVLSIPLLFFKIPFIFNPLMYALITLMTFLVHKGKYPLSTVIIFSIGNVFLGFVLFFLVPIPFYYLFSLIF